MTTKPWLRQNAEMRKDGIFNWTLPAYVTTLTDGSKFNVCPSAGACASVCYARQGTYRFPVVAAAHRRNLEAVLNDLDGWAEAMLTELDGRRYRPTGVPRLPDLPRDHLTPEVAALLDSGAACVRVHDAGDFFSAEYLAAWLNIARRTPDVLFYAYTKQVTLWRAVTDPPPNFLRVFSLGGTEDHLVNRDTDQHADVFPDDDAIIAAGHYSQDAHDLLSVVAPNNRIGIPTNNIPAARRRLANRTFSQLEAARRAKDPEQPLTPPRHN